MTNHKQKLELTWIGKDKQPKLEPRILIEDPQKSYGNKNNDNLLIHGDNLLALKALEQEYAGKVKCIFIDPPYNTGSAFTHYDDGLEHSIWLSLMRDRLRAIRCLLSNEGSLWITIDDNESHYLKVLCDEIFGRENFLSCITWQKKYSVSNNFKGIASICDSILVYSKSLKFIPNMLPRTEESKARYSNPDNDKRGPWKAVDYLNQATPDKRPNLCYDIINPNTGAIIKNTKKAWKYDPNTHQKHEAEKRLWWGKDGKNTVPALKLFLSDVRDGMTPHNWWPHDEVGHTDEAKKEIINLFGDDNVFDTPKPERLIKRIIEIATNPNDLVLDSFLGSGTTAAVAHKMGRRWIGIELGDHCYTHCLPRLKKVCDGTDQGGISESVNWKGGGGFRYYDLAPSLLKKDKYNNWIIEESYNADMLAASMAKHEGFKYLPDEELYWKQGNSTNNDFIFTTTLFVTVEFLDKIHEEMKPDDSLLICCKSFSKGCEDRYSNITVKKIPKILLGRCEFGKEDYSFNIINMPKDDNEPEFTPAGPKPKSALIASNSNTGKKNKNKDEEGQLSLF
jgi:adenine-specific DNA-methyltransferase